MNKIYSLKYEVYEYSNVIKIYYVDDYNNLYAVFDQYENILNKKRDNWDLIQKYSSIGKLREKWKQDAVNNGGEINWTITRSREYEKLDPNIFKEILIKT